MPPVPFASPFRSFWQAGFECADLINNRGERVDLLTLTGHTARPLANYEALAPLGVRTVREGIRWAFVERQAGYYDWSEVRQRLAAGRAAGVQQLWDVCHFGFPADLTPLHPQFERRFAAVCGAFARLWLAEMAGAPDPLVVTPINEMSFLAWLGGELGGTTPFALRMGFDVKRRLAGAFIAGLAAIREVVPTARVLTTEPLIHVAPPAVAAAHQAAEVAQQVAARNEAQFQALDMLSGRLCPELGGQPANLDLIGCNFYYDNQWVHDQGRIGWADDPADPQWVPLHELLYRVWRRYDRPLVLAETSHPGVDRPQWLRATAEQCRRTLERGVPLLGVCWYPVLDRPDWDNLAHWHRSGLWDAAWPGTATAPPELVPYAPVFAAWHDARAIVAPALEVAAGKSAAEALVGVAF